MKIKFNDQTIELNPAEQHLLKLMQNFFDDIPEYGNKHYFQVRRYFYDVYGMDLNDEYEVVE